MDKTSPPYAVIISPVSFNVIPTRIVIVNQIIVTRDDKYE
jgi:hypothetical protein